VGVSRTSKTPTCIYLANRGIKAANVPIVPGMSLPEELLLAERPLKVGITKDPRRLVQIRRQRLKMQGHGEDTDYVDLDAVAQEIRDAKRLYLKHGWPVIDVSRKSVEETAATVLQLFHGRRDGII
jgi:regulator of PEP synthase PpsR (kinase-PPPase family)